MLELTNENVARLLKGLTIAVGNRKTAHTLLSISCRGNQSLALLIRTRG
jgi:hypothetical protein